MQHTNNGVLKLDKKLSLKYHNDHNFRKVINLCNYNNKLSLDFNGHDKKLDFSKLKNIYELDLSYSTITDVSYLGSVHTLNLKYCYKIIDISKLNFVKILDITSCTLITKIYNLYSVTTLVISWSDCVTDFSNLYSLNNLTIYYPQDKKHIKNKKIHIYGLHLLKKINKIKIGYDLIKHNIIQNKIVKLKKYKKHNIQNKFIIELFDL